jgi:hypothetical protein
LPFGIVFWGQQFFSCVAANPQGGDAALLAGLAVDFAFSREGFSGLALFVFLFGSAVQLCFFAASFWGFGRS